MSSKKSVEWNFFNRDLISKLFEIYYGSTAIHDWVQKMWGVLEKAGLTGYANDWEYNLVVIRLATLAKFWRCWVWYAYQDVGDPYDAYDEWFDELPFIHHVLREQARFHIDDKIKERTLSKPDVVDILIWEETDKVFDSVLNYYENQDESLWADEFRRLAGYSDAFDDRVRFDERLDQGQADYIEQQKDFFDEFGFSLDEQVAFNLLGNRFRN